MKLFAVSSLVSAATIPALVAAHVGSHNIAARHMQYARQAPPPGPGGTSVATTASTPATSPSPPPAPSPPPPPPPPPGATGATTSPVNPPGAPPPPPPPPGVGGTGTTSSGVVAPPIPTTTYTFSLLSTNPTAVPLSAIVSTAPASVTRPLDHTFTPGSQPTFLPGAPPLPNAALLAPANYPALDRVPPIDSPEVQEWIKEVEATGIQIPNIPINAPGGCPANPVAAADTDRSHCWWTCSGCTGPNDIEECPKPMSWGLTYDDGPSFYTSDLLNYLDQVNIKSTFFVVGSRVISFPNILQTQYMSEHQIAVHTWSHPQLTTLKNEEIIAELGWSRKVIKDVLGVTPNMMRPPFGDIDNRVRAIASAMGLTPVMWTRISPMATFDTDDFNIHGGLTPVEKVLQNWENILSNVTTRSSGFIVLEHDLFQQSVEVATGYILPDALAHKPPFTIQPVVTCMQKPLSDAYVETNNNKTNPPVQSASGVSRSAAPDATDASSNPSSGAVTVQMQTGVGLALVTALAGFVAGLAAIQF